MPKLIKGEKTVKEKEKEKRKKKQDDLGVCRIRRSDGDILGSGAVVNNLTGFTFPYCLITSDKVFPKDDFNITNYYLDFREFNSSNLETFQLQDVAAMSTHVIRTDFGLVIIPIAPSKKCREKETIFAYRPFDVASEKIELDRDDLRCHYVDHFDAKSFVVQSLKLKYVSGQYKLHEDPDISYQTYAQVTTRKGYSKPHGAVILKHGCEEFTVAGVLTFTNDERKNVSPVIFPLRHVIGKNPGDESQKDQKKDGPHQADGKVPPDPNREASRDQDSVSDHELHHDQQIDATAVPAAAAAAATNENNLESVTGPTTGKETIQQEEAAKSYDHFPDSVSDHELHHDQQIDATAVPAAAATTAANENNLESVTGPPIQEEAEDVVNEGTSGKETIQQEEAANSYDHFLVSEVVRKNKSLEDMLARGLDRTSRVINNWEHLSNTEEVKAPLEIRLRCKLNNEYSCTETLIGFLAVEMGEKTVHDLMVALKSIERHDVVKMITNVYPGAAHSTETMSAFASSDDNSDLIRNMATELDQKSAVIKNWKHLARQFGISGEQVAQMECGPSIPALVLMEYLYSEQEELTVNRFYEEVKNLKRRDVTKKFDPQFLAEHGEDLMENVIKLESDAMRNICVCLSTSNPSLKNWRHLASAFNVPRYIYKDFDPKEHKRPTILLLEWMYANKTDLTVGQLCAALKRIKRNDVVRHIRNYFEQPTNGH